MFTNTFTREGLKAVRVDETVTGDTTVTYVGNAEPNSKNSEPRWQIRRVVTVVSGGNTSTEITFPNGDNTYTKVWDDRTTYVYA